MLDFQETYRKTKRKLELLEHKEILESDIKQLDAEINQLRIIAHNKQADVENLNTAGITGFFLSITGKKQARLEKELAEARIARENYEAAVITKESTQYRLDSCNEELISLGDCEEDLRQLIVFPNDTVLADLTQSFENLPKLQEQLKKTKDNLAMVSKLGAFRNGTQSTSALAGTDDRLMAAERRAQESLLHLKADLHDFQVSIAPCGLNIGTEELQSISDDYLTNLYTYALITNRVEKITVILRQIGFRLDALKPKLAYQKAEQQKMYLRSLLDAAASK